MNIKIRRSLLLSALCALTLSTAAQAQTPAPTQEAAPSQEAAPTAQPTPTPQEEKTLQVVVEVTQGGANAQAFANAPVILRAARPKGPFEPTDPKPELEWAATTDAQGMVTFSEVPADLATRGLRLQAVTLFDGVTYKSDAAIPTRGMKLRLPVFEKTGQPELVEIQDLRLIIEPSEGFLIFSQTISLVVKGDKALATSLLPGEHYAKGLPIELPIKAKGINIFGPGEHKTINSTVYWQGVIKPGEPVNLQLRYSMTATEERFVYEQRLDYPVNRADIVVPLQTQFRKVPRMNDLEIAALGFDAKPDANVPGLRPGVETLHAIASGPLKPNDVIKLQLKGLPFSRSQAPWLVIALGILGMLGVVVFARREDAKARTKRPLAQIKQGLIKEREALYEELVALEIDLEKGLLTAREYEIESMVFRERLALILRKLEDLGQAQEPASSSQA